MHASCPIAFLLITSLLAAAPHAIRAANVLDNVPNDALGLVVVKDLGATDKKAARLLETLKLQFPGPLALLKSATGIGDGLDPHGDLLIAILPGAQPADGPQFAIWLPVGDYQQLALALHGAPSNAITAVTVAGEDLLMARHGNWAIVMDPDQRDRMQALLATQPAPPAKIQAWKNWSDTNCVTAIMLPTGWHSLWSWAAAECTGDAAEQTAEADASADPLFGEPAEDGAQGVEADGGGEDDFWVQLRGQFRAQVQGLPELIPWANEADAIAFGVRIDGEGNALAGVRIALRDDLELQIPAGAAENREPPALFQSGDYILAGTARLNTPLAVTAAGGYARLTVEGLKNDIRVAVDDEVGRRFQKAMEQATSDVRAAAVLTRTGEKDGGIYSNAFLAVRVDKQQEFIGHVGEVFRLWNEMNKSDDDESKLVFESDTVQISGRESTEYTLDMVEAFGGAALPEVRPSMERLFGPGGKLRLLVVPIDEQVVLLAAATVAQATPVIDALSKSQPMAWDERTNRLLPQDADMRLMFSPEAHARWLSRQMSAMLGPVIGAPRGRHFPKSPPVGITVGLRDRQILVDIAAPAETIRAAGQYLRQR